MRITYYLFRKSIQTFEGALKDREAGEEKFVEVPLKSTVPFEAKAFLQQNHMTKPSWLTYVLEHCEIDDPKKLFNQSNSFVLLLRSSGRIFAVAFGHGFTILDRRKLEPDFGLKVALNTVDPNALRSVQARNVDPTTVSKQLVVNRNSPLSVFDVDFYQDLLARLEGVPSDEDMGSRVSGSDSCALTADVPFTGLAKKCEGLLAESRRRKYRQHFGFVDQLRPIRDESLIAELENKLAQALRDIGTPELDLALPDIGKYEEIEKYSVQYQRWKAEFSELALQPILEALFASHTAADARELRIQALNAAGTPVDTFHLRDGAVFQTTHGAASYVLTLGKWYRVERDYVKRVNAAVAQLDVITDRNFLPVITDHGHDAEGKYNQRAAQDARFSLMDKKLITIPGESRVEFCDLFSRDREFIHVKRHTSSQTLSHLLAQGSVSARLFHQYPAYRADVRQKLAPAFRKYIGVDSIDSAKFTVVYAISAPPSYHVPQGLPFFTKVNLLFHASRIRMMGFKVKLYHIHEL